jgi:hypothetical protein
MTPDIEARLKALAENITEFRKNELNMKRLTRFQDDYLILLAQKVEEIAAVIRHGKGDS